MTAKIIQSEIYRWLVLGLLGVMVIIVTGLANRDVYNKQAVDRKLESVIELHDKDVGHQQKQLDRIEDNVERLVDRLLDEE